MQVDETASTLPHKTSVLLTDMLALPKLVALETVKH